MVLSTILTLICVVVASTEGRARYAPAFPFFIRRPQLASKRIGEKVTFNCEGRSGDTSIKRIYWKFRGETIKGNDQLHITTVSYESRLSIDNVTEDLEGSYCCRLYDGSREEESCTTLKLKRAPTVQQDPVRQSTVVGDYTIFTCTIKAHPTPTIAWTHNGTAICRNMTNKYCSFISPNYTTHIATLEIFDVQQNDSGMYQCNASNDLGSTYSESAVLHVSALTRTLQPPSPQDIVSTSADPSTTYLQSSITGNSVRDMKNMSYSIYTVLEEHYTIPGNSHSTILVVLFLGVTLLVIFVLFIFCIKKNDKLHRTSERMVRRNALRERNGDHRYADMQKLKYPIEDLEIVQELGEGVFGLVFKARAPGLLVPHETATVAVKMIRSSDQNKQPKIDDFRREAELLSTFRHQNIIQLLGICFDTDSTAIIKPILCLLFEYMDGGDLCAFLRNHGPDKAFFGGSVKSDDLIEITGKDKLTISTHIACGMTYLAERNFIHRDLATRNCLISARDFNIKIADFGLSRRTYASDYYKAGDTESVPIRWMSPEAVLYGKYSSQSDVWAFGVTLWEIYSFALQPYFSLTNEEVICCVCQGKILNLPGDAPQWMYNLMRLCWQYNPEDRPCFSTIHSVLQAISINNGELPLSEVERAEPRNSNSEIPGCHEKELLLDQENSLHCFNIPPPKEFTGDLPRNNRTESSSTDLGISSLTTTARLDSPYKYQDTIPALVRVTQTVPARNAIYRFLSANNDVYQRGFGAFEDRRFSNVPRFDDNIVTSIAGSHNVSPVVMNARSDSCLPDSPLTVPSIRTNYGSDKESII